MNRGKAVEVLVKLVLSLCVVVLSLGSNPSLANLSGSHKTNRPVDNEAIFDAESITKSLIQVAEQCAAEGEGGSSSPPPTETPPPTAELPSPSAPGTQDKVKAKTPGTNPGIPAGPVGESPTPKSPSTPRGGPARQAKNDDLVRHIDTTLGKLEQYKQANKETMSDELKQKIRKFRALGLQIQALLAK